MDRIGHLLKIAAAAALCQATLAVADDWPTMREGKWQILESRGDDYRVTTECTDPIGKLSAAADTLDRQGCAREPLKRSGNRYRFTVSCQRKDEAGKPVLMTGMFSLTVRGDEYFQMQTDSETAGVTQRLRVEGKRLGACDSD